MVNKFGRIVVSRGVVDLKSCRLIRFVDVVVSIVGLLIAAPIIFVFALVIKLDGGPVFFRQDRVGYQGRIFQVMKLRSMIVGADDFLNSEGVSKVDRVTKVGRIARRFSIDEIPQFLNILKGEMSLVGPRPILPSMLPYMSKLERERFSVPPGVTGLAQIKGRNFIKWSRRFRYDIIYARRRSLCIYLWVLGQTFRVVLFGNGVAHDRNSSEVDDVSIRELGAQKGGNCES